jgi:hypothetical protein
VSHLARHQEIAGGEDRHIVVPQIERSILDRRGGGNTGIVDDDVDAAIGSHRIDKGRDNIAFAGDIHPDAAHAVWSEDLAEFGAALVEGGLIDIGEHDAGAFRHQPAGDGAADAAGPARHQGDAPGEVLGLGHALELCFFQQPIFDVEGLLFGQADIVVDTGRPSHDIDGVDIEFGGDAGGGLVGREGDHADAGNEVDHRIRIAHGRRIGVSAALIIGSVAGAIVADQIV